VQRWRKELIRWAEESGVDGFKLTRTVVPESFKNFIDVIVPEHQSRGVYRTAYVHGSLRLCHHLDAARHRLVNFSGQALRRTDSGSHDAIHKTCRGLHCIFSGSISFRQYHALRNCSAEENPALGDHFHVAVRTGYQFVGQRNARPVEVIRHAHANMFVEQRVRLREQVIAMLASRWTDQSRPARR
jgi:hypothetical protein